MNLHEDYPPPRPPLPEFLAQRVPHASIAPPEECHTPLTLITESPRDTVERGDFGLITKTLAESHTDAAGFYNTLLRQQKLDVAMRYLAWAMPKRNGLWWAFRCSWDLMLDRDREHARKSALGDPAAEPPSNSPKPRPAQQPPKAKLPDDFAASLKDHIAKGDQAKAGVQQSLQDAHTHLRALAAGGEDTPGPAASPQSALLQHLRGRMSASRSMLFKRNIKPMVVAPAGAPGSPLPKPTVPKGKPKAPMQKLSPMQTLYWQHRAERRMQGLALTLQWILDPSEETALEAGRAAKSVEACPTSKLLCKSAFWCGENLNLSSKKTKVPPPPTLAYKGIASALNKGLSLRRTTWSRTDKLHWFLQQGIAVASGKLVWNNALEEFDAYAKYMLESHKEF